MSPAIHLLPAGYCISLVSDHGFERVDHTVQLPVLLKEKGVAGEVQPMGGIAVTKDKKAAEFLRHADCVGREIPAGELARYALKPAGLFAFEAADHLMFGSSATGPYLGPSYEIGNHGFWHMRHDYRSVYLLWGAGVTVEMRGPMQMIDVAGD